ncbi:CRISPR-associated endonuclease Cas3'' [Desulfurococcus amylolyticus]|uniref:CRISPR-associated HD domain protein n=1 Tax=Desulfurococcus amylolyticus DSM 16532 TaxID=768672 RepID=I3XSI0_DESAM|nr:CRISPR-associated endonuclease Cas3'' [Desulfurococcus amylolyticus]AFL66904.1 CRISPR-associated HD domain protein [Desulfurococcus amylolyticus DSM 16532]
MVKCDISEWPLAYYEVKAGNVVKVSLQKHLVSTSRIALSVFGGRIKALDYLVSSSRMLSRYVESIRGVVEATALLHDIGKASKFYCRGVKQDKVSFELHEYIPAVLLADIAVNSSDEQVKAVLKLAARAISRHHTPIRNRHPSFLPEDKGKIDRLVKALKVFLDDRDEVSGMLSELEKLCSTGELCSFIVGGLRDHISRINSDRIIEIKFNTLESTTNSDEDFTDYKILVGLTGMLMVADNIAANCEGRVSDDKHTPSYVTYWLRELNLDCEKLNDVHRDLL